MTTIKSISGKIEKIQISLKELNASLSSLNSVTPQKPSKRIVLRTKDTTRKPVKAGNKGGPNKSHEIRCYFEKHGMDSRPRDVIKSLSARGIEVSPPLVSITKGNMLKELGEVSPRKEVRKTVKSGRPLPSIVTEILASHEDGLGLSDLRDKVIAAGYNYEGAKEECLGVYNNCYQILHSLKSEKHHKGFLDTTPVVLLEDHKYRINPSAKRKTA